MILLGAGDSKAEGMVSILRVLRWTRFMRLLRAARIVRSVKSNAVMRKLAFHFRLSKDYVMVAKGCFRVSAMLLILVHFFACIWYAIGKSYDNGWVQVNALATADVEE